MNLNTMATTYKRTMNEVQLNHIIYDVAIECAI